MEFFENWQEEKRSAYLYQTLSEVETNPVYKKLFYELSLMAEKQASLWEEQIRKGGSDRPLTYKPDTRAKFIAWLAKCLGTRKLKPVLAAMKVRGMSVFHSNNLGAPYPTTPSELEHRHRSVKEGGNLRAAVFGVCDGLLSNASLILGVAGAEVSHSFILLSGLAGLLAGAFSMGSGEYISVRSQREMLEHQIALEKHELDTYPEEEAAELALIYEARGLPKEEAVRISQILIQNPDKALETLAREELGVDPNSLGSPWGAAFSSFFSFAAGAFIPLLPFIFGAYGKVNLFVSIGLTGFALFGVGAILSLFTQKNAWLSGLRVFLIGSGMGCLTFMIGQQFQ